MEQDWEEVHKIKSLSERIERFHTEKNPMRILYEEQFTEEESKTSFLLEGLLNAYSPPNRSLAGDCRILLKRLLEMEEFFIEAVQYLLEEVGIRLNRDIVASAFKNPRIVYLQLLQKFVKPGFKLIYIKENFTYGTSRNFVHVVGEIIPENTKKLRYKALDMDEVMAICNETLKNRVEENYAYETYLQAVKEERLQREFLALRASEEEHKRRLDYDKFLEMKKKAFEEQRKKEFEEYNERRRKELELWNALQKPENGHILDVLKGLKIV